MIILLPLLGLAGSMAVGSEMQMLYSFIALFIAFVGATMIKWVFVDPMATVAMVVSFNEAVEGQTPSLDLKARLATVSGKFRNIMQRTESQELPGVPDDDTDPYTFTSR